MSRISVVVPIYNVEDYLERCLDSIGAQTYRDLEVVMVNDGSTDSSPAIAEAYAARDDRYKLVHRVNGGLSAARNTGVQAAIGDFLAFVDSDDVLPHNAYELMMQALTKTGSDFATGKVLRLMGDRTRSTRFLAQTFKETRLKTHITKFRPLLADRTAWNKVFRRAFWDQHGLEFPEGRINEDIPVMLPLHFVADAVDVIAEPVYLWRQRDIGELSITERRAEKRALQMRLWAVRDVHDFLANHGFADAKRWYDEVLVADDLKYYLNVLDQASEEYRQLFLDEVNALLDSADDAIFDPLPAIERLKWLLVRRRQMDELLEVLHFQRVELEERSPIRSGRHWLGDYPFRTDPLMNIPEAVYRLDQELTIDPHIESMRLEDGRLRIDGWVYLDGIGAAEPGSQRVGLALLRPGRLRRLRYLVAAVRFKTREVHRPDVNARAGQKHADVSWSGFTAMLDYRKLRRLGRWREGTWELYLTLRAHGARRVRSVFEFDEIRPPEAVEMPASDGVHVQVAPTERRGLAVEVSTRWAAVRSHRVDDGTLELAGEVHGAAPGAKLELREAGGRQRRRFAVARSGDRFTVRLPLGELAAGVRSHDLDDADGDADEAVDPSWELHLGRGIRVALPADVATETALWPVERREVALTRTREGHAALTVRQPRALLTAARWSDGGALALEGTRVASDSQLVLFSADRLTQHPFALRSDGDRFEAVATPAAITTLAGTLPLQEGRWRLCVRPSGEADPATLRSLTPHPDLAAQWPLATIVDHKRYTLTVNAEGDAIVVAGRNLDDDERGPYHQRRLRRTVYAARREEPLVDAVVYTSFRGRQYSDSPRAIHEELVRRGAPFEHLWVVRDAACSVPDSARTVRDGSREHYEAMARARFVVTNDHFPEWFERRRDQTCVQTWHGTPLKKLGFDVSQLRGSPRKFERGWVTQIRNWQYVVSPNRFTTPILRRAFALEGEMLETGYPRDDVLAGPDREALTLRIRERLGIPEGVRTVLYAPTFRDQVKDAHGRYRLDLRLDLNRLREAAGPDTVLLLRKHHYIVDDVPAAPEGFMYDVSRYPDGTELLLAADVLVTDYSSMTVDFANTGRPMLFYTYDIETYRNDIRGLYVDFEQTVPGPLLTTSDELAEALRDVDAVAAQYAGRYAAFAEKFCELDDGGAAARVVDRVFGGLMSASTAMVVQKEKT